MLNYEVSVDHLVKMFRFFFFRSFLKFQCLPRSVCNRRARNIQQRVKPIIYTYLFRSSLFKPPNRYGHSSVIKMRKCLIILEVRIIFCSIIS